MLPLHESLEECPLQGSSPCKKPSRGLKGPIRVLRLCILGILLPSTLIGLPLYMRYHVYGSQLYPLAMSDMRMIDNKISTTWCQRQLVHVNTTYNAFLLADTPSIVREPKPLSMVRHLVLEDDTKEYWGFYLLKGSSVTVSTCSRWPGASLIIIRGHKHLHQCAYIGDNSSEELDEIMEAIREKGRPEMAYDNSNESSSSNDSAPVNEPSLMKRHRSDVEFHLPQNTTTKNHNQTTINSTFNSAENDIDDIDSDSNAMRGLLDKLRQFRHQMAPPPRNSTIARGEALNFQIDAPTRVVASKTSNQSVSEEALDDILMRLESLGSSKRKSRVLERLNQHFSQFTAHQTKDDPLGILNDTEKIPMIGLRGRHYSKPTVKFDDYIDRAKRDVLRLKQVLDELNEDDEKNDLAIEEGFVADGIADHRGKINETTPNDYSNSEFWSSFSSSEEALLNCAGLILNLPLTPHHKCHKSLSESQAEETTLANTITYE